MAPTTAKRSPPRHELRIDQIPAKHKEWNGKLEALNGNVRKEFFDPSKFTTIDEMRHALAGYIHTYNHECTHHGMGGILVPADRYYGRVDEVTALLEASDPVAAVFLRLDVSQRTIEPLRVVLLSTAYQETPNIVDKVSKCQDLPKSSPLRLGSITQTSQLRRGL